MLLDTKRCIHTEETSELWEFRIQLIILICFSTVLLMCVTYVLRWVDDSDIRFCRSVCSRFYNGNNTPPPWAYSRTLDSNNFGWKKILFCTSNSWSFQIDTRLELMSRTFDRAQSNLLFGDMLRVLMRYVCFFLCMFSIVCYISSVSLCNLKNVIIFVAGHRRL